MTTVYAEFFLIRHGGVAHLSLIVGQNGEDVLAIPADHTRFGISDEDLEARTGRDDGKYPLSKDLDSRIMAHDDELTDFMTHVFTTLARSGALSASPEAAS